VIRINSYDVEILCAVIASVAFQPLAKLKQNSTVKMKTTLRQIRFFIHDVIFFIPNVISALFIPPASDDIQSQGDLIYEFGQAILHIPSLLRRLPFKTRTLEEELQEVRNATMTKENVQMPVLLHRQQTTTSGSPILSLLELSGSCSCFDSHIVM